MSTAGSQYVDITAVASTGLTSNQYYIVRSTGVDSTYSGGNLTCLLCTSATGGASGAKGVLQNDPDSGQGATIRRFGKTKVSAGGTINVGDKLTCSTGGQALAAGTTGQWIFGEAESASTATGQVISAWVYGSLAPWMGSTA